MYKHRYETRYGDYKTMKEIKISTLLDFIQDVAVKDSARCGYGMETLGQMNLAWMLQGINVKFFHPASTKSPIEVLTAVKTLKGATSERGCIIKQEGERIAHAISNWFLFNTEKMRVGRIPPEMLDAYEYYDFEGEEFEFNKAPIIEIEDYEYSVTVSNKEIDTNRHLNNQKGAELLMDALPFDFEMEKMNILFKKPSYLGENLHIFKKKVFGGYYVHIAAEENDVRISGVFEGK